MFYCKDKQTGSRKSLRTRDPEEADLLIQHKNLTSHGSHSTQINRQVGMAYLSSSDPTLVERVWQDVMDDIIKDKAGPTLHRWKTAIKDSAFDQIRNQVVVTTQRHNQHERLLAQAPEPLPGHRLVTGRILPKKQFPQIEHKEQRAITWREHCRIVARETDPERRDFYELCWHFGGSQSDIANLQGEDFDYKRRAFAYHPFEDLQPQWQSHRSESLGGAFAASEVWPAVSLSDHASRIRSVNGIQTAMRRIEHQGCDAPFLLLCLGRTFRR
jgi:hypothetical protein